MNLNFWDGSLEIAHNDVSSATVISGTWASTLFYQLEVRRTPWWSCAPLTVVQTVQWSTQATATSSSRITGR